MRILALSDLHSDEMLLDRLHAVAARSNYDLVIFAGDITARGPVSYAEEAVSLFPKVYAVHGNMDPPEVVERLRDLGVLIHGKKVKFKEWNLVGIGGSNPTPFGTPSEYSEEQIGQALAKAGVDEFSILVSHPPPYSVFDSVGPVHVGSKAVRETIEKKKPLLCICGHIHEYEGKEILGETFIVKLGPAEKMRAAEIEIKDSIDVKFINL